MDIIEGAVYLVTYNKGGFPFEEPLKYVGIMYNKPVDTLFLVFNKFTNCGNLVFDIKDVIRFKPL